MLSLAGSAGCVPVVQARPNGEVRKTEGGRGSTQALGRELEGRRQHRRGRGRLSLSLKQLFPRCVGVE